LIIANAEQDITRNRAARHGYTIGSAADAYIAANHASRNDNCIVSKPCDQIAVNRSTGHVEIVIVELEIYTPNPAIRHDSVIAVVKSINDTPTRHEKAVVTVTLIKRPNLATSYLELVDIISLTNVACNASARNEKAIETIALIDISYDRTGMNFDAIYTGAEHNIAIQGSCSSGWQKQRIITIDICKSLFQKGLSDYSRL